MPYAADNTISQKPITGGVEISDAKYQELMQAQINGNRYIIRDGQPVILSQTKRTVYSTTDKSTLEIAKNADTPEEYTDTEPGEFDEWDGQYGDDFSQTMHDLARAATDYDWGSDYPLVFDKLEDDK